MSNRVQQLGVRRARAGTLTPRKGQRADWEKAQAKVFARWCNLYLAKGRASRNLLSDGTDMDTAFRDAVALVELLRSLYAGTDMEPKRWPRLKDLDLLAPNKQLQRRANASTAMKTYKEIGIPFHGITPGQIEQGNWTMTLGMIWSIILHANFSNILIDGVKPGEEALLLWCQNICLPYKGIGEDRGEGKNWPRNFSSHWADGRVLNAILHHVAPSQVDYDSIDKANAHDNIEHAFCEFEKLGVARLIDTEDMIPKPDSKSVKTYVSELFKAFAGKNRARQTVISFIQTQKRVKELGDQYTAGAQNYLNFVKTTIQEFNEYKDAETEMAAQTDIATFKEWTDTAHDMEKDRVDTMMLYANIQSRLTNQKRLAWKCADELSPDALEAAQNKLSKERGRYFDKLRKHRFSFIAKEKEDVELMKECERCFNHFDKVGAGTHNEEQFFAALAAMGVSIPENEKDYTIRQVTGYGAQTPSLGLSRYNSGGSLTGSPREVSITKDAYLRYMSKYFTRKDTPESILAAAAQLGDPKNFDGTAVGFKGEDLELYEEEVPDKNLDAYVRSQFSKDSSSY